MGLMIVNRFNNNSNLSEVLHYALLISSRLRLSRLLVKCELDDVLPHEVLGRLHGPTLIQHTEIIQALQEVWGNMYPMAFKDDMVMDGPAHFARTGAVTCK